MPQQLQLCDPYLANEAKYEVIELGSPPVARAKDFPSCQVRSWRSLGETSVYLDAVADARAHCVLHGREVWVVDRNDADWVAFRVTPEEYTARQLAGKLPALAMAMA